MPHSSWWTKVLDNIFFLWPSFTNVETKILVFFLALFDNLVAISHSYKAWEMKLYTRIIYGTYIKYKCLGSTPNLPSQNLESGRYFNKYVLKMVPQKFNASFYLTTTGDRMGCRYGSGIGKRYPEDLVTEEICQLEKKMGHKDCTPQQILLIGKECSHSKVITLESDWEFQTMLGKLPKQTTCNK